MSEVLSRKQLPETLLGAEHLPTIPAVAVEVLRLCRDDDTTLDDLAQALQNDAALAARLLRFANSSLYDLGSEVSTLQRATLVLGMKTVQLMSLSFSLAANLPQNDAGDGFDYQTFWRRSMIRAVVARALASRVEPLIEDECFLCGLLADLGRMVLARCLPDEYAPVLAAGDGWPSPELEEEMLGFRHSDVGDALLRSWKMPDLIAQTVLVMTNPANLEAGIPELLRTSGGVLLIAEHATDLLTETQGSAALANVEEEAKQRFEMSADEIGELLGSAEESVRETARMLSVKLPQSRTFEEIVEEARGEFMRMSVATIQEADDVMAVQHLDHRRRVLREPRFIDRQTGIPNRDAFDYFMEREIGARISGFLDRPLGLLLIEVDRLSSLDSTFGPAVREEVLRLVGNTILSKIRHFDLASRMDDRHFAVIMGEASPYGVRALAERLRRAVEACSIDPGGGTPIRVTITLGGACVAQARSRSDGWALLEVARRYLQRARARGSNRYAVHGAALRPGSEAA